MKRSRINDILTESDEMIRSFGFNLPKFAYWSVKEFVNNKDVAQNIINSRLGWDITDYGSGNFDKLGLFLFTLRNGKIEHLRRGIGMCYAEKLMISRQDQLSPMHRHLIKAEDIINRGGAKLVVELYGSDGGGMFDENSGGTVHCDGVQRHFKAGEKIVLLPGDSVTLMPGDWHAFWGEGGDVLISEVSTVNDDNTDNVFRDSIGRFANIIEDEPPKHLLVNDYAKWFDLNS